MTVKDIFRNLDVVEKILIRNGGENANDRSFFYMSQVNGGLFEGSSIVADRDHIKMFVYKLEEQTARSTGHEVYVASSSAQMNEMIQKELRGQTKVGVNKDSLTVNMFESVKKICGNADLVDVSKNISEARMIKDMMLK